MCLCSSKNECVDRNHSKIKYCYLYSLWNPIYQIIVTYNFSFHLLKLICLYLWLSNNFRIPVHCFEHTMAFSIYKIQTTFKISARKHWGSRIICKSICLGSQMNVFWCPEFLELKCLPKSQIISKKEVRKKGVMSVRSLRDFAKSECCGWKQSSILNKYLYFY